MNIGFIHHGKFPEGGAEKVTSNLAPYLTQKGYQVFVFVSDIQQNLLSESDKKNISLVKVNREDFSTENSDTFLIQTIKKLHINILIFVGHTQFNFKKIKQETGCKTIFSHHGTPFWEIEDEKQYLIQSLKDKKKNFLSYLKHRYIKLPKTLSPKRENLIHTFTHIYQNCDAFTTLCEPYKDVFVHTLRLKNPNKIIAIPNGILPPTIDYQTHKRKQLLYMGRMSYADKRVDRLIEIWKNIHKNFPDWECIIVGDGAERKTLEKRAEPLERIHFMGATKTPHLYYNEAAILCMTSQFEGIPLVLLEAQQAGVIPIAFNCSAGVETILSPSWENGVLIDGFNLKKYENALSKLMKNESIRQEIQKNTIKKSKEYNMEIIAEKWHQLFLQISQ